MAYGELVDALNGLGFTASHLHIDRVSLALFLTVHDKAALVAPGAVVFFLDGVASDGDILKPGSLAIFEL